jgi:hypothetical protein
MHQLQRSWVQSQHPSVGTVESEGRQKKEEKDWITYGETILHFAEAEYSAWNSQQNLKIYYIIKQNLLNLNVDFFKVGELSQFTEPLPDHLYNICNYVTY